MGENVKETIIEEEENKFFVVKCSIGKEDKLIATLNSFLKDKDIEEIGIYSALKADLVKGYIFVEAKRVDKLVDVIRSFPYKKGVIQTPIDFKEVEKYIEKRASQAMNINERDVVEVIFGPFKGDRAKVIRVVPGKDKIVIESLNSSVPIPITLNIDSVRLIKDEEKKED